MQNANWADGRRRLGTAILALLLGVIGGCSTDREPGELFGPQTEVGTVVVDAQLIVDQPLPQIYLWQVAAPGEAYTPWNRSLSGAQVEVRQGGQTYAYSEAMFGTIGLGRYNPPFPSATVLPNTTYDLVVVSGEQTVTASTTTPGRLRIERSVLLDEATLAVRRDLVTFADGDQAVYTAWENYVYYLDGLLEVWFQPVDVQAYQVGIFSLDLDSERVIDADWLDEEDYEDLERQESSPPFEARDGKLRLPWFAIYYGGRHLIRIYALDTNWFDFVRSSPDEMEGGNFGGLAGEEFERPIFHVDGGIGLFGSASVDSLGFFVLPKE